MLDTHRRCHPEWHDAPCLALLGLDHTGVARPINSGGESPADPCSDYARPRSINGLAGGPVAWVGGSKGWSRVNRMSRRGSRARRSAAHRSDSGPARVNRHGLRRNLGWSGVSSRPLWRGSIHRHRRSLFLACFAPRSMGFTPLCRSICTAAQDSMCRLTPTTGRHSDGEPRFGAEKGPLSFGNPRA